MGGAAGVLPSEVALQRFDDAARRLTIAIRLHGLSGCGQRRVQGLFDAGADARIDQAVPTGVYQFTPLGFIAQRDAGYLMEERFFCTPSVAISAAYFSS